MLKKEVIDRTAEAASTSKKDTEAVLQAFEQLIIDTLTEKRDEKITLGKLGSFQVKRVDERRGKVGFGDNKGKEWVSPAHDEIYFKKTNSTCKLV